MLVILDCNVLVSAALSAQSPCAGLLRSVRGGRIEAIVSPALLAELRTVLSRPKFRRWLSYAELDEYLDELVRICQLVADPPAVHGRTRDPKDDYLVALAVEVGVDLLVSGDKDLLQAEIRGVQVVTPRDALTRTGG